MQKTRIGKLDFQDIKDSLKNYLSQQTEFTDYNFEGSNISQLLNILAYNAHYDALAANYLANEVFLDTATKRSSVISRAKELGYTSRSRRASNTTLTVKLKNIANEDTTSSVLLPKGSRFSTKVNEEIFTFATKDAALLNKQIEAGSPVFVGTVQVYEGILVQHTKVYDGVDNTMTIPNVDVDTSTLKVELYVDNQWVEWTQPQSFLSVTSTSNVYMIQEGFNGYEIYFGDGVLGAKPLPSTPVRMTYIVTSGDTANGASVFSLSSSVSGLLSNTITTITSSAPSQGGSVEESIESIKLNSKNSYSTQNRAVTSEDYASLAQQNFPIIKEVLGWSGSDNVPPKFGRTILCVIPTVGDALSISQKESISSFLQKKGVGNVKVEFVDPEYINIEVVSNVKYSLTNLQLTPFELEYLVKSAITGYSSTAIKHFKSIFRYSSLVSAIDAANYAIVGNETTVSLNKEYIPNMFSANNFVFTFSNKIKTGTFRSSEFSDGSSSSNLYLKDLNGAINVYYSVNGKDVLYRSNVGVINYTTGAVVISGITIANIVGLKFKLYAIPESMDVYSNSNVILSLKQDDIKVNVIKDSLA